MNRFYYEQTDIEPSYTDEDLDLLYDEAEPIEPETRENQSLDELGERELE